MTGIARVPASEGVDPLITTLERDGAAQRLTAQIRESIMTAALQVFSEDTFAGARLQDVAARANVRVSFSYVMNRMDVSLTGDPRNQRIAAAVYDSLNRAKLLSANRRS